MIHIQNHRSSTGFLPTPIPWCAGSYQSILHHPLIYLLSPPSPPLHTQSPASFAFSLQAPTQPSVLHMPPTFICSHIFPHILLSTISYPPASTQSPPFNSHSLFPHSPSPSLPLTPPQYHHPVSSCNSHSTLPLNHLLHPTFPTHSLSDPHISIPQSPHVPHSLSLLLLTFLCTALSLLLHPTFTPSLLSLLHLTFPHHCQASLLFLPSLPPAGHIPLSPCSFLSKHLFASVL